MAPQQSDTGTAAQGLLNWFGAVRARTEAICRPLETEDHLLQCAPQVSPPKWHLAHTTWFFEQFILQPLAGDYRPFHPRFGHLFNSYYETVGEPFPRSRRGLLSRPTLAEVETYRRYVDDYMRRAIETLSATHCLELERRLSLGLHHEQQHQELLLMDIQYNFSQNPLRPAYHTPDPAPKRKAPPTAWHAVTEGESTIGHEPGGFCFDNEQPAHRVHLRPFRIASRPVTNGEYLTFMEEGGYARPELWLADGWATVQQEQWRAPLYWFEGEGNWQRFGLAGAQPLNPDAPVCHVSYYEADAYARWAGARLADEAEWETVARRQPVEGNFCETGHLEPIPVEAEADAGDTPQQLFGDVWEWTRSPYLPYPGYRRADNAFGEYNGKFMCNQMVLRGGSCATPAEHMRASYRNFFYPHERWQFAGIRLAEDA